MTVASHRYAKRSMIAPYLEPVAADFDVISPQALRNGGPKKPISSHRTNCEGFRVNQAGSNMLKHVASKSRLNHVKTC